MKSNETLSKFHWHCSRDGRQYERWENTTRFVTIEKKDASELPARCLHVDRDCTWELVQTYVGIKNDS